MSPSAADTKLILASASPRRRQLLTEAGIAFEVQPAHIDEDLPSRSHQPWAEAERLALAKARTIAEARPQDGRWVLGADTIVVLGDEIIGKPLDDADAMAILGRLSGASQQVITGVALVKSGPCGQALVRSATTLIIMRPIPPEEIRRYVASGASRGKAGAYAIQEGGDKYVERMEGSLSNVVGLPMEMLREMLAEVGLLE